MISADTFESNVGNNSFGWLSFTVIDSKERGRERSFVPVTCGVVSWQMEATHGMMHADKKGPLLPASLQHDDPRSSEMSSEAGGSSDESTATLTSRKLSFGIDQILDSTTSFRSPGVRPSHSRDADFRQYVKLLRDGGSHGESQKECGVHQYDSFNDWVGKFHTVSTGRRPLSSMTFSRASDACQRSLTTISSTGPCGGLGGQEDTTPSILPLFGPGVPLTTNPSCTFRGAEAAWAERCPLPWQPTQRDKLGGEVKDYIFMQALSV